MKERKKYKLDESGQRNDDGIKPDIFNDWFKMNKKKTVAYGTDRNSKRNLLGFYNCNGDINDLPL